MLPAEYRGWAAAAPRASPFLSGTQRGAQSGASNLRTPRDRYAAKARERYSGRSDTSMGIAAPAITVTRMCSRCKYPLAVTVSAWSRCITEARVASRPSGWDTGTSGRRYVRELRSLSSLHHAHGNRENRLGEVRRCHVF